MITKLEIKAYAKINLSFEILSKLSNGYHKIRSVFQAIDLHDIISISKEEKEFYLVSPEICPTKENLITKAKKALEAFTKKDLPCRIHLTKNIPISAGLGGGSSNAAATLIGLNKLYRLNLSLNQLIKIGAKVGADVPFFISNIGTALVEGIGEKIKQEKKKYSNFYILAVPYKKISTSEMYSLFDKKGKTFLDLAKEICSDVEKLYSYFSSISNEFGMSGSGPTVFAGFRSYHKAKKAIEDLRLKRLKADFFICSPCSKTYDIVFN